MLPRKKRSYLNIDKNTYLDIEQDSIKKKITIRKRDEEKELQIKPIFNIDDIQKSIIEWENPDNNRNIPFHVGRYIIFIITITICYFFNLFTNFKVKIFNIGYIYNDILKIIELGTIVFCFGNLTNILINFWNFKTLFVSIIITMIAFQVINMLLISTKTYPETTIRKDNFYNTYGFWFYPIFIGIIIMIFLYLKLILKINVQELVYLFVFVFITFFIGIIIPTLISKKSVRVWYFCYILLFYVRFRNNIFIILIGVLIGLMLSDIGTANYFSCNFNGIACSECTNCREIPPNFNKNKIVPTTTDSVQS